MQDENKSMNLHLQEEMKDVKKESQNLRNQNLTFMQQITKIDTQQNFMKEQQAHMSQQITDLQQSISKEIREAITDNMSDFQIIMSKQQDQQTQLMVMQNRQGEQIEQINHTLEQFTDIRNRLDRIESRVEKLETEATQKHDIAKIQAKGKWSLITAISGAVIGVIATIIAALI